MVVKFSDFEKPQDVLEIINVLIKFAVEIILKIF